MSTIHTYAYSTYCNCYPANASTVANQLHVQHYRCVTANTYCLLRCAATLRVHMLCLRVLCSHCSLYLLSLLYNLWLQKQSLEADILIEQGLLMTSATKKQPLRLLALNPSNTAGNEVILFFKFLHFPFIIP
jgi:hypothetical protein